MSVPKLVCWEEIYHSTCKNFKPDFAERIWKGQDESFAFDLRLALKINMLATLEGSTRQGNGGEFLKDYSKLLERTHKRIRGLEARLSRPHGVARSMIKIYG